MGSFQFIKAKDKNDLERFYPIMKELRPHLTFEDYISIYDEAHTSDGYEIVAIEQHGEVQAVMGYRFLSDYVRGRHLYIDDLISTEKSRSKGFGTELLNYAEEVAKQNGLKVLRLCTGIENERGVKFYEKNNWVKRAFAYAKKLS